MELIIHHLSSIVGIYILIAFAIVAVFIAANHEWVEKDTKEKKGLILYYPRIWLDKKIDQWEAAGYSLHIRNLVILLPITLLVIYYFVQSFTDTRYAWGMLVAVGYILYPKKLADIWVMALGCYRCMPTLWAGIPSIFYILFFSSLDNFVWIPFVFFSVAVISYMTTLVYMMYAYLKTSVERNCNQRDCLEIELTEKKKS